MKIFRLIILCLAIILLAISTRFGMLMNYLFLFLPIAAVTMIVTVIVALVKKQVHQGIAEKEFVSRPYILRGLLRNCTWIIIGLCVYIALARVQFSSSEFTSIISVIVGSVVTLCLLDWVPRKQIGQSLNVTLSLFLIFLTYQLAMIYWPVQPNNSIEMVPPFKGEWSVFQGGNSPLLNHHYLGGSQKHALDLLVPEDGQLPLKQITDLQEYKTFGEPLYSPVDGVIVATENSLPDQQIGATDRENLAGNYIIIKTEADIFVLLAHLQNNSVLVAEGDSVKVGQEIAKIGNSGNTSQPHLHIQAMTNMDFMDPNSQPVPMSFMVGNQQSVFYKRNDRISEY